MVDKKDALAIQRAREAMIKQQMEEKSEAKKAQEYYLENCGTPELVELSRMFVDPSYQRDFRVYQAKMIAENFDPRLFGMPICNKRKNEPGKCYILDGQTRTGAARLIFGEKGKIWCMVHYGLTVQQEADLFARQDELKKRLRIDERLKSSEVAENEVTLKMKKAILAHGISIDFDCKSGCDNRIVAFSCIDRLWRTSPGCVFDEMLSIITAAWNRKEESFRVEILNAVHIFLTKYWGEYDRNRAIKQFSTFSPNYVVQKGNENKKHINGNNAYAKVLLDIYNANLRAKNKLDEMRLLYKAK